MKQLIKSRKKRMEWPAKFCLKQIVKSSFFEFPATINDLHVGIYTTDTLRHCIQAHKNKPPKKYFRSNNGTVCTLNDQFFLKLKTDVVLGD